MWGCAGSEAMAFNSSNTSTKKYYTLLSKCLIFISNICMLHSEEEAKQLGIAQGWREELGEGGRSSELRSEPGSVPDVPISHTML